MTKIDLKAMVDRKNKIRKIANELNDLGYACCRCLSCETCELAGEIFDGKKTMPSKK